jgi:hypothetical protein
MTRKKKKKPVIRNRPPAPPESSFSVGANIFVFAGGILALIGLSMEWLPGWGFVDWVLIPLKILCFLTSFLAAVGIVIERYFNNLFIVSGFIISMLAVGFFVRYGLTASASLSWGSIVTGAGALFVLSAAVVIRFEKQLKKEAEKEAKKK